MKRIFLGLVLLLASSIASAQIVIGPGGGGGIGPGNPGGGFPGGPGRGPGPGRPGPGPGIPGPGRGPGPGRPGPGIPGGGGYDRICFYEGVNFSGQGFCVNDGAQVANLVPSGWNDRISSITVEGYTGVYVYQDINYGGQSLYINRTVADLRSYGGQWNDFVSSFIVDGGRPNPPPQPPARGQICFYDGPNFTGQSFCLYPDQQQPNLLQSGWNDRVSSIWVNGDASVYVYQDINYGGGYLWINQTIADLRSMGAQYDNWISSMNVVRANGQP
jgi:hypothetical protein